MPNLSPQWHIQPVIDLPEKFVNAVRQHAPGLPGQYAAQLLWQRGIHDLAELAGFLDPNLYHPSSPFEFGQEMTWAVKRLQQAYQNQETIAIWGDFDADGITSTAILWEGLGQFFSQNSQLFYYIPNRLTESHGLSIQGIDALAQQGCRLIITCDTGSTNLLEIQHAQALNIDVIVTDHHTLPAERPDVTAIINPRYLPPDHPLANLSGVAVAYKLVEALYQVLPEVPERSPETLLDLVAIGLIADLVELKGDCRYLAQRGIERLQQNQNLATAPRPGIAKLLEFCKRNGDRPTDISFGIGPRINAISRIHGDARFGVELLTSQDRDRCRQLAEETELANTRRKALQKDVVQQVRARLAELDLSTTTVIVLADPQWSIGVLGLVAGQIAQEYGRPTILLSTENQFFQPSNASPTDPNSHPPIALAKGSARSVNKIDLYQLVKNQEHLLHRFGGHPFAAGLSLPVENIAIFTESINRQLREQQFQSQTVPGTAPQADLAVTVAELGQTLFRELKLLEPCGMGNPTPKLLIQNCWFSNVKNQNIKDWRGQKVRYIKTEFEIRDSSTNASFPGVWWEHYRDDIPRERCDAIAELDFNTVLKRYEIRLVALRPTAQTSTLSTSTSADWILDWRNADAGSQGKSEASVLKITSCPSSWDELQIWFRRAIQEGSKLAIAYPPPTATSPSQIWECLVGIAKYLSRTQQTATRIQLLEKLGVGDRTLQLGFKALNGLGFQITSSDQGFQIVGNHPHQTSAFDEEVAHTINQFLAAAQEEQFRRQYFYTVPLSTIQTAAADG